MPYCDSCDINLPRGMRLEHHWIQSPDHLYCHLCCEEFDDIDDFEYHNDYEYYHEWCRDCNRVFKNERGLSEHYRQSPVHHYCVDCDRHFNSENNLNNHLNSSVHRPRDVVCPFRNCGQAFVARSHLILHLEAGRCPSRVDRATIDAYVRKIDKQNIITDPSRLICGSDDNSKTRYIVTRAAWNGDAWECYLCHREFRIANALEQHMNSPCHQNKAYLCPLSTCEQRFSTLSALCQHIESQKCGVAKFRVVQDALDRVFSGMKRLTV